MTRDDEIQSCQERITYLERTVDQLNEVVVALNRKVELFEARLGRIRDEIRRVEQPDEAPEPADDPQVPPHYGLPRSVGPEQLRAAARRLGRDLEGPR